MQSSINIHVHDNHVYGPGGKAMVTGCHTKSKEGMCKVPYWL
jgi:hypothetical protein